jgi:hypothetical protein
MSSWAVAGIFGIKENETMEIIISNITLIAMAVASVVGAFAFCIAMALSKYAKQKTDATKLERKVAESGRDPENIESLTASEKWEISKATKFDKIFLIGYALTAIMGALLACAVLIIAQERLGDEWMTYAVYGLVLGIVGAWFLYETVTKSVMAGEWQKKSEEAFRIVKAATDKVAEVEGGYDALINKLMASGIKKSEAKKLARVMIADDPSILDKKEE